MRAVASVVVVVVVLAASGARAARPAFDPRAPTVRFVAIGDAGDGGEQVARVAAAAQQACAARGGCAFVALLGDNIYPRGAADVDDPQLEAKLARPWAAWGVPVVAVLGNHDYGAPAELSFLGGVGFDRRRAAAQIAYGASPGPVFVARRTERLDVGPVELELLDTVPHYWRDAAFDDLLGLDDDADAIERALRKHELERRSPWRVVLGHHPYRSNGEHGDAGAYDGIPAPLPGSGGGLKRLYEQHVLGRVDAILCGHDHDLSDQGDVQGTALFVIGGGAEPRTLASTREVPFAAASRGFAIVEATTTTLTVSLVTVDDDGRATAAHARTLRR